MVSDMKGQMAVGGELNPLEGRRMVNKLEDLEEAPAGSSLPCTQTERVPPNCLLPRLGWNCQQPESILPETLFKRCAWYFCFSFDWKLGGVGTQMQAEHLDQS